MANKKIAIIPARKGSKRLPNKNIIDFDGIPLIEHSINFALNNADLLDDIYITTDCEFVKKIGAQKNIKVIDRPTQLATDTSSIIDVLKHVENVIPNEDVDFVLLQPTNPLRPHNLLKEAIKKYDANNCESLITVSLMEHKFGRINNQSYQPINYKFAERSQDIEALYYENGLLYIFNKNLLQSGKIIDKNNYAFVINHVFASIDIDYLEDLNYAKFIINSSKENK